MIKSFVACALAIAFVSDASVGRPAGSDQKISALLNEDRDYTALPEELFGTLGWNLPDGGRAVKALADSAPGGAFDPRFIFDNVAAAEGISPDGVGRGKPR